MKTNFCKFKSIAIIAISIVASITSAISYAASFSERKEVKTFINSMSLKHGLNKTELNNLFSKYSKSQEIINKISKPYEGVSWERYRKLFLSKKRINDGITFWKTNAKPC